MMPGPDADPLRSPKASAVPRSPGRYDLLAAGEFDRYSATYPRPLPTRSFRSMRGRPTHRVAADRLGAGVLGRERSSDPLHAVAGRSTRRVALNAEPRQPVGASD